MIEKYFAEFYVSEQELKEEIHSTLTSLNILDPEKWPGNVLEHATPQKPSQEFLLILNASLPELSIDGLNLKEFELIEVLRLTAIKLKLLLNGKHLDYLLTKQLFMMCSNFFLGLRYLLVTEILSTKLNREPRYNPEVIFSILTKDFLDPTKVSLTLLAAKAAHEEIDKLFADESAAQFVQHIREFERAAEKYIKDNYFLAVFEAFTQIANEAFIKNVDIVEAGIQLGAGFTPTEIKDWADEVLKIVRQNTSRRLGIKKGGKRERHGFAWTDEKKMAFFKKVESLPKVRGQSCWQFALNELIDQEFSAETVSWLKSHPAFKTLPESLFRNAVKVWRKYLERENWSEMKREESPRAFELRHALHLLEYPDKFTFSTLETHFYAGKKLAKSES